MDGLILAAGFGSRLRGLSPSKPLAEVNGVSLLEIACRQLASAGVTRTVVVTGYRAQLVEETAMCLGDQLGTEVITQRLSDWEKPNGYSVMAGASHLPGDYLLVMCDHILTSGILRGLVEVGAGNSARDVTLAVDRRTHSPLIDPDDATWVRLGKDGLIDAIGKQISPFDAVDCGAFFATPALARAIEAAIDSGKSGSLSDGMQWLAGQGRAATFDVGEAWWMDVDDPKAHAQAQDALGADFTMLDGVCGAVRTNKEMQA